MIFYAIIIIILCFGLVVLFGAPYLPTLKKQSDQAFALLGLKAGETFLDIGCGDGRLLIQAAKRGLNAVGIELNPILFVIGKILTFRYRKKIKIIYGNFWLASWPKAEGIYVFLHPRFMKAFINKIEKEYPSNKPKLVSYAFKLPGVKINKQSGALYYYDLKK